MARQIFAAEISHEDAPLYIREQMTGNEAVISSHLQKLRTKLDEVFILSTCNRFTIYAVNENINPLVDFFSEYAMLQGYVQYYYNSEESITHLFAVASGLLSPIKGDHLVLDQLKQAHAFAIKQSSIGITLDNLLCQAIAMGKRVRTETGIDKFCSSVIDAGMELLYSRLDSLHNKKVLIIGTGKIARHTAKCLYNEGIQQVKIVSRDAERAAHLAELYYLQTGDFSKLYAEVQEADVIIGGTHYEVSLFSESFLCTKINTDKMWFILDFGMPRNFNHKLAEHSSIELYNLDDLKRLHKSPLDAFGGIEAAWSIVMTEAKMFLEIMLQLEHSPVLAAYWNKLLRSHEVVSLPRRHQKMEVYSMDFKLDKNNLSAQSGAVLRSAPTKHLTNNLKAENPRMLVKKVCGFEGVRLNVSLN
jgi:glutamyl-tRNA reductase